MEQCKTVFQPASIHWITLIVTMRCNLRCQYCYEEGMKYEVLNKHLNKKEDRNVE